MRGLIVSLGSKTDSTVSWFVPVSLLSTESVSKASTAVEQFDFLCGGVTVVDTERSNIL